METKLDWKFLLISLSTNALSLVILIFLCALIGSGAAAPQSVVFPCAIVSVVGAGAVTGIVISKFAPSMPLVYAVLCGSAVTAFICISSAAESSGAAIRWIVVPLSAFLSPIAAAYFFKPKNDSKKKLRHLGIKI